MALFVDLVLLEFACNTDTTHLYYGKLCGYLDASLGFSCTKSGNTSKSKLYTLLFSASTCQSSMCERLIQISKARSYFISYLKRRENADSRRTPHIKATVLDSATLHNFSYIFAFLRGNAQ